MSGSFPQATTLAHLASLARHSKRRAALDHVSSGKEGGSVGAAGAGTGGLVGLAAPSVFMRGVANDAITAAASSSPFVRPTSRRELGVGGEVAGGEGGWVAGVGSDPSIRSVLTERMSGGSVRNLLVGDCSILTRLFLTCLIFIFHLPPQRANF
jgi:hypothetical protein